MLDHSPIDCLPWTIWGQLERLMYITIYVTTLRHTSRDNLSKPIMSTKQPQWLMNTLRSSFRMNYWLSFIPRLTSLLNSYKKSVDFYTYKSLLSPHSPQISWPSHFLMSSSCLTQTYMMASRIPLNIWKISRGWMNLYAYTDEVRC